MCIENHNPIFLPAQAISTKNMYQQRPKAKLRVGSKDGGFAQLWGLPSTELHLERHKGLKQSSKYQSTETPMMWQHCHPASQWFLLFSHSIPKDVSGNFSNYKSAKGLCDSFTLLKSPCASSKETSHYGKINK